MTHAYDESIVERKVREALAAFPPLTAEASMVEREMRWNIQSQMLQVAAVWGMNNACMSALIAAVEGKKALEKLR